MEETEKITIRLNKKHMRWMEFLVEFGDSPSKTAIIQTALRDYLYDRMKYVMEKAAEMEEAEMKMAEMEAFKEKYLRK